MTAQELLGRLGGVRGSGPQWTARCPAHEDDHPSLSIREEPDGKILLNCHAGCPTENVVRAIGVEMSDLMPDNFSPNGHGKRIVTTYDYTDESGMLLSQVVRFDPKDFRVRRPDGNGDWIWNVKDTRRVLYRLLEVVKAASAHGAVFVCEGEKDCDRLAALGLTTTCNPGGAGKWRREYGDSVRGAHVLILPDNDPPGREHGEAVARSLHGTVASLKVVELLGLPEKGDVSDWLDAGYTVRELLVLVKQAPAWTPGHHAMLQPKRGAPVIYVREALNEVTNEALAALEARPDLQVFVRARLLATVSHDGSARNKWVKRPPGSPVIVPIEQVWMLSLLDAAATWTKMTPKGPSPTKPPAWVADQVLGRLEWPFPYLEGVVECPTLRPDGSVLDTPGWDESTALLYEPLPGSTWPTVPSAPTGEEITQAKATLLDPVRDFPFLSTSDRSAYVAAVLTLLARHLINGPVPLFAIRAPTPGTGKTLLASVVALIGVGREPAVMTHTSDEDEWRKVMLTLAIDGTPLVLLDNLSGSIGSDTLAAALTAREWEGRILGATQRIRAPLTTTFLATGNNLGFKRTLARRVIPVDLDARVEAPEDRSGFRYPDLLRHAREHRAEYVVAALTILRGFHLAGRPPHGQPRVGSYEDWDDLIRSAVVWAGWDDPASTEPEKGRGRMRSQADDDAAEAGELLAVLLQTYEDGRWWTAREVIEVANGGEHGTLIERREGRVLQAVLDAVAPHRGGPATVASLGYKLRSMQGRPVGGLRLDTQQTKGRAARWCVRRIGGQGGL